MDTEDVGLQISLLRGTVGTVSGTGKACDLRAERVAGQFYSYPSPAPRAQRTMIIIASTISAVLLPCQGQMAKNKDAANISIWISNNLLG